MLGSPVPLPVDMVEESPGAMLEVGEKPPGVRKVLLPSCGPE
jgi:hypothetical protein